MTICVLARLLLLAALPALAGRGGWSGRSAWGACCVYGEVVAVTEGAGPALAPRQRTAVVAAVGQTAALECRVLRLGDKAVSWVRSRDLQILSHAGAVFTADSRVSAAESAAAAAGATRHTLRIERLRASDAGRYECQVNTEPKLSLLFNLTVLDEPMPTVVVSAGARVVRGRAAGAATLACEARYEPPPRRLPLPQLDIRWYRDDKPISLQGPRGGVSLDTERWQWRAASRLTLAALSPADAGHYTCVAAERSDTVTLTVDADGGNGQLDGMQLDEAAEPRVSGARTFTPLHPVAAAAAAALTVRLLALLYT